VPRLFIQLTSRGTNNIIFEASREVQLNNNFEVKQGGNFTARIIECGEQ